MLLRTVIFTFAYRIRGTVKQLLNVIKNIIHRPVIKNLNFTFYTPYYKNNISVDSILKIKVIFIIIYFNYQKSMENLKFIARVFEMYFFIHCTYYIAYLLIANELRLDGYKYVYNLTNYLTLLVIIQIYNIIHNLYVIIIIANVDLNLNNIYLTYFDINTSTGCYNR